MLCVYIAYGVCVHVSHYKQSNQKRRNPAGPCWPIQLRMLPISAMEIVCRQNNFYHLILGNWCHYHITSFNNSTYYYLYNPIC